MKFLPYNIVITYQPRQAIGQEEVTIDGVVKSSITYSDPYHTTYVRELGIGATGSTPELTVSNLLTKLEIDQELPSKMEITNIEIT
jgi:hypothetical protein